MTIQEAKSYGKKSLPASPTPALDTEVLLQFITGFDRTHLLLERDFELTGEQEEQFFSSIKKRKTGLPVAYITGHKEFFALDFLVTPDVLIPKPDTELLVELALDALEDRFRANPNAIPTVCDMCAGSGCVGLSIAKKISSDYAGERRLSLTLVDISEKALAVAKKNAARLLSENADEKGDCSNRNFQSSSSNLHFVRSNLFENIPQSFDVIATNPPYVPHSEALELLKDGRSEPILALDGDVTENGEYARTEDGLSLIRRLVPQCHAHLNRNGVLIMETGEYNAQETAELFKSAGFQSVRITRDLSGMPRVVQGRKGA